MINKKQEKKKPYVQYKCGCVEIIPEYGITGGKRCDKHQELQTGKVVWL